MLTGSTLIDAAPREDFIADAGVHTRGLAGLRVALAHDYLTQRGGAERVALAMAHAFPGAPLYTSVYEAATTFPGFAAVDVRTSFLQDYALPRRDPRWAIPALPYAWDSLDPGDVDVVIASSTGWAHALRPADDTPVIVYCHNPARWLYQQHEYFGNRLARLAFQPTSKALVAWDKRRASRASLYLANSSVVQRRVQETYRRPAEVLHPPVMIDVAGEQEPIPGLEPGFWLTVSRGRGYKNVSAVIDGVKALPGRERLVVVGQDGQLHSPSGQVYWTGVVSDANLRWLYANARALVSVSFEDFGLTPLEANSFGTPSAVLRAGGFLDSTAEGVSGMFIEAPTGAAVANTLRNFPQFDPAQVRAHAATFDQDHFTRRLQKLALDVVRSGV